MIRVRQVKVRVSDNDISKIKMIVAKKIKVNVNEINNIEIVKRSLDARYKPDLFYIYEVDIDINNEKDILNRNKSNNDISVSFDDRYVMPNKGDIVLDKRIVFVGSGPAGLFCAYLLAKMGYNPLVIERGEKLEDRVLTVENFWNGGKLNKKSNVQFGEGGAGTFSDGKLNTLTKDKFNRCRYVFETFVECGADKDIMISNMPHIGTDVLRDVVKNLRNKIIDMGGEFRYNSCLTKINIDNDKVSSIEINNSELIDVSVLVLAIGHSARDTFEMLNNVGLKMEPKAFAVGIRIQHSQEIIKVNQ